MDHTYGEKTICFNDLRISKYVSAFKTEFMYGGYLTAMALVPLVLCMALLMDEPVNWQALAISYLLPLIIYGYDYYMGRDGMRPRTRKERSSWKKDPFVPAGPGGRGANAGSPTPHVRNSSLTIFVSVMVLGGIAYPAFFKDVTRTITGFKSIYVSLIWAAAATFIPFFLYSTGTGIFFALAFAFIFMKTMINVIFFDIKDMEADRDRGLKTIPALLGKDCTFKFLHGLNLLTLAPILVGVYSGFPACGPGVAGPPRLRVLLPVPAERAMKKASGISPTPWPNRRRYCGWRSSSSGRRLFQPFELF